MHPEISTTEPVYVLDDDPSVLRAINRLLSSEGINVRSFSDPVTLFASMEGEDVPVVILDVWMEQITGLEVQTKLARLSPRTRVIVMTGRGDPGVERTAVQLGAAAFFVKPFNDQDFIKAVRSALAASPL